jgi:hypothetical protein
MSFGLSALPMVEDAGNFVGALTRSNVDLREDPRCDLAVTRSITL